MNESQLNKAVDLFSELTTWRECISHIDNDLDEIEIEATYTDGFSIDVPSQPDPEPLKQILRAHAVANVEKLETELRTLGVDPTLLPDEEELAHDATETEAAE